MSGSHSTLPVGAVPSRPLPVFRSIAELVRIRAATVWSWSGPLLRGAGAPAFLLSPVLLARLEAEVDVADLATKLDVSIGANPVLEDDVLTVRRGAVTASTHVPDPDLDLDPALMGLYQLLRSRSWGLTPAGATSEVLRSRALSPAAREVLLTLLVDAVDRTLALEDARLAAERACS